MTFNDVLMLLHSNAQKHYNTQSCSQINKLDFKITKAILFPYNKEMDSLINFHDLLSFDIVDVYSCKYLGHVNKTLYSIKNNKSFIVKDIDEINWNDIDTLILGHTEEISNAIGVNYSDYLLQKCCDNNVNVYSFDNIGKGNYISKFKSKNLSLFYPEINANNLTKKDGKLYQLRTPVLAVFGTSSVQGKYTLQLYLRELFIKNGYNVGQIATEPTALLFGMDNMFPFGYASSVDTTGEDTVEIINEMMHNIDIMDLDIILTGSQSGTMPSCNYNIKYLNIPQLHFLIGVNPDAVILCVNIFDDLSYIKKTINVIENITEGKVITIVISPLTFNGDLEVMTQKKSVASIDKLENFKKMLYNAIKIPVFIMGTDENEMIFNIAINYFCEES